MMPRCIICDIDNVYVDSREWERYLPKDIYDRKGWNSLIKHANKCIPNDFIINIINILAERYPIFFITSREDSKELREVTVEQIEKFSGRKILLGPDSKHRLYMRKFNDFREAHVIKEEILLNKVLPKFKPVIIFEDNEDNAKMYEKHGLDVVRYTEFTE